MFTAMCPWQPPLHTDTEYLRTGLTNDRTSRAQLADAQTDMFEMHLSLFDFFGVFGLFPVMYDLFIFCVYYFNMY